MLFNSTIYLIFLTIVVWCFYQLGPRYRPWLLLFASYTFYWVWSIPWSLLLFASTLVNYTAAIVIDSRPSRSIVRKLALFLCMFINLAMLATFKYADFLADASFTLTGLRPWPTLNLVLPMGISFYTFQLMSYTVDVYRRQIPAQRSLMRVALFITFFPQLVAGPIERAGHLMQQLSAAIPFSWHNIQWGVSRIVVGMIKKVFIADSMALIVSEAYAAPESVSGLRLLFATYAFAIQIYCDFSAYSDIAIGSARMLGIELMENFNAPYLSCSIRDFWRRWHISLSTWLRDYLFIPLGGSRGGTVRTYINLILTMLLGGLWHGAGWNWVVWGGLQGAMLAGEKFLGIEQGDRPRWKSIRLLRWFITFHLVCLSWVFFRSHDLSEARLILVRITTMAEGRVPIAVLPVLSVGTMLLLAELFSARDRWTSWCERHPAALQSLTLAFVVFLIFTFSGVSKSEFIYFQF